ncbi:MAG: hypothetical protein RI996_407 [Candidatus Parcubacteria bacterium]|jgi:type I restriction enzyme M protein
MLTQDTKKHIDAARQILVGVVPNPMSQVEQITNALIYKFMDDMDQQAIKAGGDPSFFTGDLEKYRWSYVMGEEGGNKGNQWRMNVYSEALMKFSEAKQLPQLFRDIFKQAFLPYRDPEVLGLFLKEISYFDYTHSEELGNAYEYLLSIMSSQGDAGQFRTPRHIIDFIVDVLGPTKDDSILDPACGTGGFLISAYNYIKRQNEGVDPETGKMRQLTADERRRLVNNFEGYDVDPTMVRMSQVNMYLHKFTTPKIYNYNTLASEDRWNDKFDLILANPPFMSPKGGIKPHNKFSVQANRAEVLFVDYIMNHLKPKGRAGIIVPEGIIFQSGKAYKELRKNLINEGLFVVVSLPAGVFNPYSGVKTSILFFDNEVAKKTKDLLFIKVTSDGYDLGAQRRKIEKDDLGDAGVILKGFREYVRTDQNKETIESFINGSGKGFIVSKEKISETGDYNLSADRYRNEKISINQKWPLVDLGEVCDVFNGYAFKANLFNDQKIGLPVIRIRDVNSGFSETYYNGEFDDKYLVENGDLLIGMDGDFKATIWNHGKALLNQRVCRLQNFKNVEQKYIYYLIQKELDLIHADTYAVTVKHISSSQIAKIKIPLPPLHVQKEIVEQIEVKQKAIEGAKQVIENLERERRYFGQSLRKLENVDMVELGELLEYEQPTKYIVDSVDYDDKYNTPVLTAGQTFILGRTNEDHGIFPKEKLPVIIFDDFTTAIKYVDFPFKVKSSAMKILHPDKDKITAKFIFYAMQDINLNHETHKRYWISEYSKIKIPLPSIEVQNKLLEVIEDQEKIIESNKKLIEIMEKKIEEVLSEI